MLNNIRKWQERQPWVPSLNSMGYHVVSLSAIARLGSLSLLYSLFLLSYDSLLCSRRVFGLAFILFSILIVTFLVFVFGRSDTKNSCYNIIFNTPGRFRFLVSPLIASFTIA
jgi:hypothetical protein